MASSKKGDEAVALTAPNGQRVLVAESKVDERLRGGYRRADEQEKPARRGRSSSDSK